MFYVMGFQLCKIQLGKYGELTTSVEIKPWQGNLTVALTQENLVQCRISL